MKTVLCYGDSNTYGYDPATGKRYPPDIRYPGRLATLLGGEYRVVEEGCNGRTTVYDDPEEGWKNGMDYLRPCLNSHKPVDIVVLMLGSNDLKEVFHASAKEIADGAGRLVDVILEFTQRKQGFSPRIILVSPPRIGKGMAWSPFSCHFKEDSIERSAQFPVYYGKIAREKGCEFFDAAAYVEASALDSLHLTPEAHEILADKLCERILKL